MAPEVEFPAGAPELDAVEGRLAVARAIEDGVLAVPERARDALLLDLERQAAAAIAALLHGAAQNEPGLDQARVLLARFTAAEDAPPTREKLASLEAVVRTLRRPRPGRAVSIWRAVSAAPRRAALVTFCLLAALALGIWLYLPRDLAKGAPFRTSSVWAVCDPEKLLCGGFYMEIFFHTHIENEPWIEFDLGTPQKVSRLFVRNRHDFRERAVPLVVEVSNDRKTFREVIRRDRVFGAWLAEFRPVETRWVRLRVAKHQTALHLETVEIYSR